MYRLESGRSLHAWDNTDAVPTSTYTFNALLELGFICRAVEASNCDNNRLHRKSIESIGLIATADTSCANRRTKLRPQANIPFES